MIKNNLISILKSINMPVNITQIYSYFIFIKSSEFDYFYKKIQYVQDPRPGHRSVEVDWGEGRKSCQARFLGKLVVVSVG